MAVVDWNWAGHHPALFANFVLALEELGCEVLAICPNPEEARAHIGALRVQRGMGRGKAGGTEYRAIGLPALRFAGMRPSRIGAPVAAVDWAWRHFRGIEALVQRWQAEAGKRVDLIFYACVYDWDFQWFRLVEPFLKYPWAGLYLHALSFRMPGRANPRTGRVPCPEKYFGGAACKGVAVLDEGIAAQVAAVTGKPVAVFPDLPMEGMVANNGGSLGERLRCAAGDRPIVGLFGYLQPSKGLLPFLQAARQPEAAGVTFALAGEFHGAQFSSEEKQTICEVLSNGRNTWNHLLRIPDEAQLNSVLAACDVLYAAYLDFPHSSGFLAKAALLGKPVIVSEGYLMAERVRKFRMGEVVPQGDVEAIVGAILSIVKHPQAWVAEKQPRWQDYLREHSFARLKESFQVLLGQI